MPPGQALGIQGSGGNGSANGASRLQQVCAIGELARGGKIDDFGKQDLDTLGRITDVERTHSRRVDHPTAACHGVERARGRGVTSLGIVGSDLSGLLAPLL